MKDNKEYRNTSSNKQKSSIYINIYSILAIIIVIIPEKIAEAIFSTGIYQGKSQIPRNGKAWEIEPELRLSKMNLKEIRMFAKKLKLIGYSNEGRDLLSKRIIKVILNKKWLERIQNIQEKKDM